MIERLPTSNFVGKRESAYIDVAGLFPLYDQLAFKANLLLQGPKGQAKSTSIATYCAQKELPAVTFDCSEDIRRSHLVGMFVLRGNDTPFVLGPLTTAFEVANEVGRCVLILEELNALAPAVQKVLNAPTDFRRALEVPEAQKVFRLKPEARLWIVGTMNASTSSGAYALNDDLKSRFRIVPVDYPSERLEREILERLSPVPSKARDYIPRLIRLARESRQPPHEYELSTRDLAQTLEDTELLGVERALWLLSGKYEAEERDNFKKRVRSLFGVDLNAQG